MKKSLGKEPQDYGDLQTQDLPTIKSVPLDELIAELRRTAPHSPPDLASLVIAFTSVSGNTSDSGRLNVNPLFTAIQDRIQSGEGSGLEAVYRKIVSSAYNEAELAILLDRTDLRLNASALKQGVKKNSSPDCESKIVQLFSEIGCNFVSFIDALKGDFNIAPLNNNNTSPIITLNNNRGIIPTNATNLVSIYNSQEVSDSSKQALSYCLLLFTEVRLRSFVANRLEKLPENRDLEIKIITKLCNTWIKCSEELGKLEESLQLTRENREQVKNLILIKNKNPDLKGKISQEKLKELVQIVAKYTLMNLVNRDFDSYYQRVTCEIPEIITRNGVGDSLATVSETTKPFIERANDFLVALGEQPLITTVEKPQSRTYEDYSLLFKGGFVRSNPSNDFKYIAYLKFEPCFFLKEGSEFRSIDENLVNQLIIDKADLYLRRTNILVNGRVSCDYVSINDINVAKGNKIEVKKRSYDTFDGKLADIPELLLSNDTYRRYFENLMVILNSGSNDGANIITSQSLVNGCTTSIKILFPYSTTSFENSSIVMRNGEINNYSQNQLRRLFDLSWNSMLFPVNDLSFNITVKQKGKPVSNRNGIDLLSLIEFLDQVKD
jgi:hypothetical protein